MVRSIEQRWQTVEDGMAWAARSALAIEAMRADVAAAAARRDRAQEGLALPRLTPQGSLDAVQNWERKAEHLLEVTTRNYETLSAR